MIYYKNKVFDSELKYEIFLLKEYLTKHYDEERAIMTMKNNSNDLDKIAKALGAIDIAFFSLYFMSDIFVVKDSNEARDLSNAHYELWELANDTFVNDKHDKLNILEPRGLAKTTIFNLAVGVWLHCYKKSKFTLIGAKKDADASQFLDSIKKVFYQNKKIIKCFGVMVDIYAKKNNGNKYSVNSNEVEFTNGTYIRVIGSGTSVRGANWGGIRPSVVIADDFQSNTDVLTEDARNKKYNNWTKEIEEVGDKAVYRNGIKIKSATKIITIGTVLNTDCLMSRLSRNGDYKTILRRAIILEPNQTVEDILESDLWLGCKRLYFNDKDENRKETAREFYLKNIEKMRFPVLWPEKWDCFNDLALKYWENRISFMTELMNDASAIGERWINSVATQHECDIEEHKFIKTVLVVDPASTVNNKADYTAIGVGSKASNDFTYVRDYVLKKLELSEYCNKVIELLIKYKEIIYVYIEKNTYNGADVLRIKELINNTPELYRRKLIFVNRMQKKNKDEKISIIMDPMNNGQIIINSDVEDCVLAIEQIKSFQGQLYTPHDDFLDMLAEMDIALKEIKTVGILKIRDYKEMFR